MTGVLALPATAPLLWIQALIEFPSQARQSLQPPLLHSNPGHEFRLRGVVPTRLHPAAR